MLITTKGKGIELLNKALPYPEQMKNIDLDKENAIYFEWRSDKYKLDLQFCSVDRSNCGMLEGNDASILMTKLLKMQLGSIM
tara:strand:+ start:311 stop:556 length:246 start_codon:yes stop_codon:yes gene_type:complete